MTDHSEVNWAVVIGSMRVSFNPMPGRVQSSEEIDLVTATLPDGRVLVPRRLEAAGAEEAQGVDFEF